MAQSKCKFEYQGSKLKKIRISGPNFHITEDIISKCPKCGKKRIIKNAEMRTMNCWGPFPFHYEQTKDFWKNVNKDIIVENEMKKSEYEKTMKMMEKIIFNINKKEKIRRVKTAYHRYKYLREFLDKEKVLPRNKKKINKMIKKEIKLIIESININKLKEEFKSVKDYNKLKKRYNYLKKISEKN
ncbi:hypothetical protein GF352_04860 [archaeon]|nr:hypothetical protein [archaeon]